VKRFVHWIVGLPVALAIIAISVANRRDVRFSLDPFSTDDPFFAFDVPLYAALLVAGAVGLVCGGAASWLTQGKWRRAARDARADAMRVRDEHETFKRRVAQGHDALIPPPS